jgi:UPF0716 protein FxsA
MAVVLVLLFLVVPILEIFLIIQVGQVIGGWQTVALLVLESLLGGWIVKREGRRAWRALRSTLGTARMPERQLADAALVLVGGTLLLTPGFLTDVVGFFLVLPFTRPFARRLLTRWVARRAVQGMSRRFPAYGPVGPGSMGQDPFTPGPVVQGEVVDPRTEHRPGPQEGGRGGFSH